MKLISSFALADQNKRRWIDLTNQYSDTVAKSFLWLFTESPALLRWLTDYSKERKSALRDGEEERKKFFEDQKNKLKQTLSL